MSICVPTYTLGGVLTAYFGLSVGEALLAILFANIIVLIPLTLNAFAGTKYGIPFPVLLRSSFGVIGSNVPCLIRSEEHTSELQSLMRISYAVFCLKNKNTKHTNYPPHLNHRRQ